MHLLLRINGPLFKINSSNSFLREFFFFFFEKPPKKNFIRFQTKTAKEFETNIYCQLQLFVRFYAISKRQSV